MILNIVLNNLSLCSGIMVILTCHSLIKASVFLFFSPFPHCLPALPV